MKQSIGIVCAKDPLARLEHQVLSHHPDLIIICFGLNDVNGTLADYQNSGKMDLFVSSAVELAEKMQITVCDCYRKWKTLSQTQDTTLLLANRINHPTREMHELFAESLYETLFGNLESTAGNAEDEMFER